MEASGLWVSELRLPKPVNTELQLQKPSAEENHKPETLHADDADIDGHSDSNLLETQTQKAE